MTGFIVTAPIADADEPAIVSGAFWPEISPREIRDEQRIDETIPPARLRPALIEAIAVTNRALRSLLQTSEVSTLADLSADKIDDVSLRVHQYRRAVGCYAKALLLERIKDFDATGKADKKAETLTDPIDDCRRDHRNAIADLLNMPRVTVELI